MKLSATQFAAFFEAVHGVPPLPWQTRLAKQVLAGEWPDTIAMPTASGKTAVLDVATFAFAAGTPGAHARRIFFVVDRRVVVDDAYVRAQRIATKLARARAGVLRDVADALRQRGGEDDVPLATAIMRGGLYRDDLWAGSPVQPTLILSTVDQVGSRLLFRGYGLSASARPIHAGLVGNDALIILDEAHCSRPFRETLGWVKHFRAQRWAEEPVEAPFAVVTMTATPPPGTVAFTPEREDLEHDVLKRRFDAAKPAKLILAKKADDAFVKAMAAEIEVLADAPCVVGAIVNRVAVARALHGALREKLKKRAVDVVLLTGRVRAEDRDQLLRGLAPQLKADPLRAAPTKALVVVATQCIEVGADLDFDALVTECASLDALRQRFGRLNRLGRTATSPAAVLMRDPGGREEADPVYGLAMLKTWGWLDQHSSKADSHRVIDFGVNAMGNLLATASAELPSLLAPSLPAPILTPSHLDCLVQTAPEPHVSPDPAAYLHGVKRESPDVNLVWRADLPEENPGVWADCVSIAPPVTGETMAVPLSSVRAWLQGQEAPPVADVEGLDEPVPPTSKDETASSMSRLALRWRGPDSEETRPVSAGELRPGDTVVVPAGRGGCDEFGWNPETSASVVDLAERLQARKRRAILRLHSNVTASWPAETRAEVETMARESRDIVDGREAMGLFLSRIAATFLEGDPLGISARFLSRDRRRRVAPHPSGEGYVVSSSRLLPRTSSQSGDVTDEDETSSASSLAVPLLRHLDDVEAVARGFLALLPCTPRFRGTCSLGARTHDLGKSDPRFQLWLHGGDRLAAARTREFLAKSGGAPRSRDAILAARKAAGYPPGARHELISVRLVEQILGQHDVDGDLVLQLVASHHGYCRPFAPVAVEPHSATARVVVDGMTLETSTSTKLEAADSGVAERFWRVVRRYGWWGEAWAEAVVRLADHRASEMEQEQEANS